MTVIQKERRNEVKKIYVKTYVVQFLLGIGMNCENWEDEGKYDQISSNTTVTMAKLTTNTGCNN